VWAYVEGLDLSTLLDQIKAVPGRPGQPAIDPRILLSLWLVATLNGVGSARELDRLTEQHIAYEWLCGHVSVNYHTLTDFRSTNEAFLNELLTQSVATLMEQGLVELQVRMGTEDAKTTYKRRASTAEWANARVRNWGLYQVAVRGLEKVRSVALLFALAHNFQQTLLLKRRLAAA